MSPVRPAAGMAQVFLSHQRDLCRYFERRLRRSREDAADLTQEVGLRFLSLDRQFWPDNPRGYLFGIARYVLTEFLKRRAQQGRLDDALMAEPQITMAMSVDFIDPAERLATVQQSALLLSRLPRRQREVILAQAWEGDSHEEAAARLGLSVETVRIYLKTARAQLRSLR